MVVIPLGSGPSLYPTARVARSIKKLLNKIGGKRARLYYPQPQFPRPKRGRERKADRLLKQIRTAYRMMEYTKVAKLAEKATKTYKKLVKSNIARDRYVVSLHYRAAAALFEGKQKAAFKAMNDAYLLDPEPPSKKEFSPQVQELYQQVVTEPPTWGVVRPSSSPQSLVWFNEQLLGPSFGANRLRAGLYLIRFYRPGYLLFQRWFRVHPNKVRDLHAMMTADASVEPAVAAQLRAEARAAEPGTMVNQMILDQGASEVILVTAKKGCTELSCRVVMRWAKDGSWIRRRHGTFRGKAAPVAGLLVKRRRPRARAGVQPVRARVPAGVSPILPATCSLDNQCGFNQVCRNGKCVTPSKPVTKKWWFWTLVGVAVAGATVAIVVPVTRPGPPVIEVK